MKYDREKLEEALAAVMNCNTIDESLEEFRRHMGITTYSDPENQDILGYGSIGHNARVTDFIMQTEKNQIEFSLILSDLKKLFDVLYPGWETINIELKGKKEDNT